MAQGLVRTLEKPLWKEGLVVLGASLILGLLGKVMIPLPFTPVPIALRSFLVLLVGATLGPKRGTLAVLGFLAQGMCGLPVFAHGGAGIAHLVGPNGGYLLGYIAMAYVTGALMKRGVLLALSAGTLALWMCGAGYLSLFVGVQQAFVQGILPFMIGDSLKVLVLWKALRGRCSVSSV